MLVIGVQFGLTGQKITGGILQDLTVARHHDCLLAFMFLLVTYPRVT